MKPKESGGWLAQLDGLRGISILMVLTAHVYSPGWPRHVVGRFAVRVFFVLSGYLITRLLLREQRDTGGINLPAFYIRRTFRLFPAYYLVLGIYCILILGLGVHADGRQGFLSGLPYYLTYMQDIPFFRDNSANPISMPFGHSWSLGIEEKFYFLWPLVAFRLLRTQRGRTIFIIAAAVFFSAARFVPYGQFIYPYAAIACGCLFAILHDTPGIKETLDKWSTSWRSVLVFLSWPILLALAAIDSLPALIRIPAELIYPCSVAFVIVVSLRASWLAKAFAWRPFLTIGRYSYGIYLIHLLVRQGIERVLVKIGVGADNGLLIYVLMLLLSTAVAAVIFRTVEDPCRELGRRLAISWTKKTPPAVPEAPPRWTPSLAQQPVGEENQGRA